MEIILPYLTILLLCCVEATLAEIKPTCPTWGTLYPYSNGVDASCYFSVSNKTKQEFFHAVMRKSYNFINFVLHFNNKSVHETRCAVEGNRWVWTFPGPEGARQYLNWPQEYRIWSLGTLNVYTLDNFSVPLAVHGNCDIRVGENETQQRVALALANLTDYLITSMESSVEVHSGIIEYFNQSYWCYKERIFISPHSLYLTCLNVICPLEAIGYRCCSWKWDFLRKSRIMECSGDYIKFSDVGWQLPFILGLALYLYFPLLLMKLLTHVHALTYKTPIQKVFKNVQTYGSIERLEEEKSLSDTEKWIFYNPIHIGTIFLAVFRCLCIHYPILASRLVRVLFLFVSLSVLGIKLLLHGLLQHHFIIASVKKGVPKDFESIIAGYTLSKYNFLRVFGGPFIACSAYSLFYLLSTCVPKDLTKFLITGIPKSNAFSTSPLRLDDSVRQRYGAMKTTETLNGYHRLYRILLSQLFMVLNPSFWKFVIVIQTQRWKGTFFALRQFSKCVAIIYVLFLPIYVILCLSEQCLCMLYYGVPLTCFVHVTARAYIIAPWREITIWRPLRIIVCLLVVFVFAFSKYMFAIIFVDSFIFICGIFVYSYTGLFAHPEVTSGYFIFAFTVITYIFDCIMGISRYYDCLFKHARKICKKMHKYEKYPRVELFRREDENKGIPRELFFLIVKKHNPIRHQVFLSFLKLTVIILILYISVNLLLDFSSSRNLNTLTQVTATIIVCLVPKFIGDSCSLFRNRRHHHQSNEIKRQIRFYCGQISEKEKDLAYDTTSSSLDIL